MRRVTFPIPIPIPIPISISIRLSLRRGFTLIELLITMAVLAVVMAVALPSMTEFMANNQLAATKSSFAAAVALARTEATKRGRMVVVQALGSGPTGNEYANGWEVVVDDDGNGIASSSETRVRREVLSVNKIRLGGTASISFRASGALNGSSVEVFTLCRLDAPAGTRGYTVTVTPSGATDVAAISNCTG